MMSSQLIRMSSNGKTPIKTGNNNSTHILYLAGYSFHVENVKFLFSIAHEKSISFSFEKESFHLLVSNEKSFEIHFSR